MQCSAPMSHNTAYLQKYWIASYTTEYAMMPDFHAIKYCLWAEMNGISFCQLELLLSIAKAIESNHSSWQNCYKWRQRRSKQGVNCSYLQEYVDFIFSWISICRCAPDVWHVLGWLM